MGGPPPSPWGGDGLLAVGRIVRPHGLRGEVVVELTSNRAERVAPGSTLTTGDGRTLEVVTSRPRDPGSPTRTGRTPRPSRYVVAFAGVSSVEEAEALRDVTLRAPPLDDPDALWIHDLVGAAVVDRTGAHLGTVEAIQANPASDLLVLDGGALVPLAFVVAHEPGVRVTVDVPEGLLDLA